MKRILNIAAAIAIATVSAMVAGSCSKGLWSETEWDITPVTAGIYATDPDGNNLLDPAVKNNLTLNRITATFEGKTLDLVKETKTYMPEFYGICLRKDDAGEYHIDFGELNGEENYQKELIIDWGNGRKDKITIINRFKWKFDGTPDKQTQYLLNGTDNRGRKIRIKFLPAQYLPQ